MKIALDGNTVVGINADGEGEVVVTVLGQDPNTPLTAEQKAAVDAVTPKVTKKK